MSITVAVPITVPMVMSMIVAMHFMTVPMVAVAGGMAWRCHRHYHQDDRGHDLQAGDVQKGGFDTP